MKRIIFTSILILTSPLLFPQAYWHYVEGEAYYLGNDSMSSDYKKAFVLFVLSAKMGCPMAEAKVGECYYLGRGVTTSKRKAFRWIKRAAKHGVASSQYDLGTLYFVGDGCRKSDRKAYKWTIAAANRGDTLAIEFLQQFNMYIKNKCVMVETSQ